ncbi:MAG TPA: glycosyl hydrolase family 65 protein, partial [Spirochaetia bacterium]|nr:glycosyl hydrolase family 65 protein [Spirochaetia bacterium]
GIWQSVVNGFGGVRASGDGRLRISPRLPAEWHRLSFPLVWHGTPLGIVITPSRLRVAVKAPGGPPFEIECHGRVHTHPGSGSFEITLDGSPGTPR